MSEQNILKCPKCLRGRPATAQELATGEYPVCKGCGVQVQLAAPILETKADVEKVVFADRELREIYERVRADAKQKRERNRQVRGMWQ